MCKQLTTACLLLAVFIISNCSNAEGRISDLSIKEEGRPNILFLFADDWSWPHASIYEESDKVVKTPNFDQVARNGILFNNAFTAVPSCSPSRAGVLTGRYPHQLGSAANLYGTFPKKSPVYPELLAKSGYKVGFSGKGWAPGNYEVSDWKHNPAGKEYKNFKTFFNQISDDTPFCFWFGSSNPHRPYGYRFGIRSGMDPLKIKVPEYLPDNATVRMDILDYYDEVEHFDREVGEIINILNESGKLENTIVVVTSDNGWPFPRGKTNLYDAGTRMPLAISWGNKISHGEVTDQMVNLIDLAPTFLDAAGIEPPSPMEGKSLLPLLKGHKLKKSKDMVFLERERHSLRRKGGMGYPVRAVRTDDFLYIHNLKPNRWPAGNPIKTLDSNAYRRGADIDPSPTYNYIIQKQRQQVSASIVNWEDVDDKYYFFSILFDKKPKEELYDLKRDPYQLNNVAGQSAYIEILQKYRKILKDWMNETNDPRAHGRAKFDVYKDYR